MSGERLLLPLHIINAFVPPETAELGKGNPAAVVPLTSEQAEIISAKEMQLVATEIGLSETTFIYPASGRGMYFIRWFTPAIEVDLCGHATLAAASVVQRDMTELSCVEFITIKGERLKVEKENPMTENPSAFTMEFPALCKHDNVTEEEAKLLCSGLGISEGEVVELYRSDYDLVAKLSNKLGVQQVNPCFNTLSKLSCRGIIVTAPGDDTVRFVSRFFAPSSGIPEDPVTGSAHCVLAPLYLSVGENEPFQRAEQVSKRGGVVMVRLLSASRVQLSGNVRLVSKGALYL
ncbi:hypothetical protein BWQ96_07089 [Gracilariopsis chorda]|uniref:Isomerase n=1 Tax=Gracilariopsis chorda TaxID=448386 RepID=A0A2V3IM38_9FLOR|nr:hypothetical protein BWQ96_07089 [Gracilariopsis chorda]|eukprot:PXF43145.1 hypothetical protein BWQ96_07089 [Gracilariopsis chorda]